MSGERSIGNDPTEHADGSEPTLAASDSGSGGETEAELQPGDRLGRFEIQGLLGSGGMGVVYEALDPTLERRVAVKLIRRRPRGEDSELTARLLREARSAARLNHPNVVSVYEVGTDRGRDFIAMELVDGLTLRAWLRERERTWSQILEMFASAARGLRAAHEAGLIHRDFKPDNVLVADGRARVVDFGLARGTGEAVAPSQPTPGADSPINLTMTRTGAVLGTPRYMSPEQRLGKRATAKSDQYSFCVALYEALYGEHPLKDDELEPPVAPPKGSNVPARVHPVLVKGLSMTPSGRHPDMATLLAALQERPQRRRWPWVVAALVMVAAIGIAAGARLSKGGRSSADAERIAFLEAENAFKDKLFEQALDGFTALFERHRKPEYLQRVADSHFRLANYCLAYDRYSEHAKLDAPARARKRSRDHAKQSGSLCRRGIKSAQDTTVADARDAFERADKHYQKREYMLAASYFERAYKARPFPQFLYNIGASYERSQRYATAVHYYRRYLAGLPNSPDAPNVKRRIDVLSKEAGRARIEPGELAALLDRESAPQLAATVRELDYWLAPKPRKAKLLSHHYRTRRNCPQALAWHNRHSTETNSELEAECGDQAGPKEPPEVEPIKKQAFGAAAEQVASTAKGRPAPTLVAALLYDRAKNCQKARLHYETYLAMAAPGPSRIRVEARIAHHARTCGAKP